MMAKRKALDDEDEQLFADMQALSERFKARLEIAVDELYRGTPGVPRGVCKQMLTKGNYCHCLVIGQIIEAKEKAERLKQQQASAA
jgi:hypothetical protein